MRRPQGAGVLAGSLVAGAELAEGPSRETLVSRQPKGRVTSPPEPSQAGEGAGRGGGHGEGQEERVRVSAAGTQASSPERLLRGAGAPGGTTEVARSSSRESVPPAALSGDTPRPEGTLACPPWAPKLWLHASGGAPEVTALEVRKTKSHFLHIRGYGLGSPFPVILSSLN